MGLCNSPDIFQEKMNELFVGLDYILAYIDDLLILSTSSLGDHLNKLETVHVKLWTAGLKVNSSKSFFSRKELEYLGYHITRNGVMSIPKK